MLTTIEESAIGTDMLISCTARPLIHFAYLPHKITRFTLDFPLDFFLYIGITAIVRLLIIDHESALNMLLWSISILVLVCCLVLVEKFLNNKS